MKYPLLTSLFLLWTAASCHSPQEKQGSTDEKLFREYCLMNATETYDFALPGSLTVEDLQDIPVRIDSLAKEDKLILRIRGSFCEASKATTVEYLKNHFDEDVDLSGCKNGYFLQFTDFSFFITDKLTTKLYKIDYHSISKAVRYTITLEIPSQQHQQ